MERVPEVTGAGRYIVGGGAGAGEREPLITGETRERAMDREEREGQYSQREREREESSDNNLTKRGPSTCFFPTLRDRFFVTNMWDGILRGMHIVYI